MGMPLSYHWRNLFERKTTTVLTVLVIASVVAVFAWMLGFAFALSDSLAVAGDPRKLIVLKRGATAESNSAIPVDEYNKLNQVAEVARDAESQEPLLSPEIVVQISLPRLRDEGRTNANVAVRGVTETAFQVHRNVKPIGRVFSKAAPEVIVGEAAAKQFAGLGINETIQLGYGADRAYRVVGHFSAGGGPAESEIWTYLPSLMNAYRRTSYSSANLLLQENAKTQSAIEQIEGPAIELTALTEAAYWQNQARMIRTYLQIAYVLVGVMCVAAVFSIANTMFSAVAGRTREIAMLRTIGFASRTVLLGFVIAAVMLALLGGSVGCFACLAWLALVGRTKDMFGASTFTTLAFEIRLTPIIIALVMAAVSMVGFVGAWYPARRAAGLHVVSALREP
jgi:putative ABC transport system permease protein